MPDVSELPYAERAAAFRSVTSFDEAQGDDLLWRQIAPPQPLQWSPPLCLLGPASPLQRRESNFRPAISKGVGLAQMRHASVVGRGLVVDRNLRLLEAIQFQSSPRPGNASFGQILWIWLNNDMPPATATPPSRPLEALEPLPLAGTHVLIGQPGHKIFGHWLAEILPRVALAQSLGLGDLPLLLPDGDPELAGTCLSLLGLPADRLRLYDADRQMPQPETLLLPSQLFCGTHYAPIARSLLKRIAEGALAGGTVGPRRRLYVSRGGMPRGMRHANRNDLLPIVRRFGFEEIRPEELPLAEQVRTFAAASHVIAEDGSAAHLMLFSPPDLRALVLLDPSRTLQLHRSIAQLLGHAIGFLVGEKSPDGAGTVADYHIEPALLEQALPALLAPV